MAKSNREHKLLVVMGILVLFIFSIAASCNRRHENGSVVAPYYGGVDGLVAEFQPIGKIKTGNMDEVWEDESFPVSIHLMNKGEYDLQPHDVRLEIKGIARSDFSGLNFEMDNSDKIEGVSEFMKDGGEEYIDFGDAHYNNLEGTYYDANLYIYFTYPYETYITIPQVCYKENLRDDSVCDVTATKQAFASGGPFQVGTVKERYIGQGRILLEIPIKNVGKGKAKAYDGDEFNAVYDEVYFQINDPDWECRSRGDPNVARITHPGGVRGNEEVIIYCTNDHLEKDALYTKAVTITLKYYYQDYIHHVVRIRKNPE